MTSKRAREILGVDIATLHAMVKDGHIRVAESWGDGVRGAEYTYCPESVWVCQTYREASTNCAELHGRCDDKWLADELRSNPEEYHCKIIPRLLDSI